MDEALRHEVVQRQQAGASKRSIAKDLGISRGAVARALARVQAQRDGRAAPAPGPRPRQSIVDAFEPVLKELLARYPNLTVERALQELRQRGYTGGYTVVRQRMRLLRPRPAPAPVPRFETPEGLQAQMDFGVYDIDFSREGRRRVYLFSYLLGYSRRQYLRWVESMDLLTTLREHVHAFHHLGGAARVCLYDNFKVVVLWRDSDGPLYNPKFLAFATHYGFRPQACQVRRPQTKGKVERKFFYVETSLLNGRTFDTLEHLNKVTAWWLESVADVRILRDFKESPRERHAREQPHLLALPACDFDTALVVYRHVNVEGFAVSATSHEALPEAGRRHQGRRPQGRGFGAPRSGMRPAPSGCGFRRHTCCRCGQGAACSRVIRSRLPVKTTVLPATAVSVLGFSASWTCSWPLRSCTMARL